MVASTVGLVKKRRTMRLTPAHVAALPAKVEIPPTHDQGRVPPPDSFYTTTRDRLLAAVPPDGDMWLFAFGSLIWNKRFTYDLEREGVALGWHRDFCLGPDTNWRGNPDAPGYMLALDRGGRCRGMIYRFPREGRAANLEHLLRNDAPYSPIWITVQTREGQVRAFTYAHPGPPFGYAGHLSDETIADALARAVGKTGSMAEYLHNTVLQLEELGMCDNRLWRMQEMVAERIERDHPELTAARG